eukprot:734340-Alexandrium_andersonii.AAC.1
MRRGTNAMSRQLAQPEPFVCPEGVSVRVWRRELQDRASQEFAMCHVQMMDCLEHGDLSGFWELWSGALESTYVEVEKLHHVDVKRGRRKRGEPVFKWVQAEATLHVKAVPVDDDGVSLIAARAG